MRNPFRTSRDVVISGRVYRARVRFLPGEDQRPGDGCGAVNPESCRLILPPLCQVAVRDSLLLDGRMYLCASVRYYPTCVQATFRRCAQ